MSLNELNRRDLLKSVGLASAGMAALGQNAVGAPSFTAPVPQARPAPMAPGVFKNPEPCAHMPELTGMTLKHQETLPIRKGVDVIVAGGGVAGVAAALAAKRDGKDVLLLEKTTLLGGLATIGLINYFEPLCNGRGR